MDSQAGLSDRSRAVLDVRPSSLPYLLTRLASRSELRRSWLVRGRHLEEHTNIHTQCSSQLFQQIDRGVEAAVLERTHGGTVHPGIDRQMLLADAMRRPGRSQIPSYSITNPHARMPRILMAVYPSDISDINLIRFGSPYLPTTRFPTPPHSRHLMPAKRILRRAQHQEGHL